MGSILQFYLPENLPGYYSGAVLEIISEGNTVEFTAELDDGARACLFVLPRDLAEKLAYHLTNHPPRGFCEDCEKPVEECHCMDDYDFGE